MSDRWTSSRLGSLAVRIVNGGTPDTDDTSCWNGTTPWITGADFTANGIIDFRRFVSERGIRNSATCVVEQGNLLVVTRTGVGKLAIAPCDIAISQDITGIYVDRETVEPDFVYYLLRQELTELKKLNQGTSINGIVRADLEKHVVRFPKSKSEQRRIAEVLSSVDTSIERTQALITKYQQIKSGLMHDLFTRGVLPDGQLRPPRSEAPKLYQNTAIGWMPSDWSISNLGTLAKIVAGVTLGSQYLTSDGIEVPYLRVANVQDGYLDLSEIKTVRISRRTLDYLRLQTGDVLMNEGGDFDKLGRGTVWSGEIDDCVHQNHVFRVRVNHKVLLPYYLAFYSESMFGKRYFLRSSKQSTNLASINSTQLHVYPIALPGLNEQQQFIARISMLNQRIATIKAESVKLNFQKLGLMQDLLSGKVPVKVDEPAPEPAHA